MGRVLASVLFLFYTLNCFSLECKQLRIASGVINWAPLSYQNQETFQFQGVAFDIAEEVAKSLDLSMIILDLPWKRLLWYLETGELDMALAIYKNKERENKYLYTAPYFSNEARIFVKKGREFSFNRLEDLVDRAGVVPAGASFGEDFDSFAKEKKLNLNRIHNKPFKEKSTS